MQVRPMRELRSAVGRTILVKLKDGSTYAGKLVSVDYSMNLVIEDCTAVDPRTGEPLARYGLVIIRGSQVVYVSTTYELIM